MMTFHDHVRSAVKIVGSQAKLAERVGCAQSEIHRLCTSAKSISHEMAIKISEATEGEIKVSDLLPDVANAIRKELYARKTDRDIPSNVGAA